MTGHLIFPTWPEDAEEGLACEWRACGADEDALTPDAGEWRDDYGLAVAEMDQMGTALPPYDARWVEARWVSTPQRVPRSPKPSSPAIPPTREELFTDG